MAEWLLHEVPAEPTPPAAPTAGEGLLSGRDRVDDLCAAVPYQVLAVISGVPFEDPGIGTDFCEYYGGNPESGWHYALTSLEQRAISLWQRDYPEASSIEIVGQPALLVEGVLADLDSSAVAIVVVPGFDDLTFAAGIGIDTSTGTVVDTATVAMDAGRAGARGAGRHGRLTVPSRGRLRYHRRPKRWRKRCPPPVPVPPACSWPRPCPRRRQS